MTDLQRNKNRRLLLNTEKLIFKAESIEQVSVWLNEQNYSIVLLLWYILVSLLLCDNLGTYSCDSKLRGRGCTAKCA
jgi:hypothetical protein